MPKQKLNYLTRKPQMDNEINQIDQILPPACCTDRTPVNVELHKNMQSFPDRISGNWTFRLWRGWEITTDQYQYVYVHLWFLIKKEIPKVYLHFYIFLSKLYTFTTSHFLVLEYSLNIESIYCDFSIFSCSEVAKGFKIISWKWFNLSPPLNVYKFE